jgi:hypothetical protein
MNSDEQTFWISFISIVSGIIVISIKYCLKSKCDRVECLCLKIHRNTEQELPDSNETPTLQKTFFKENPINQV